MDIEAIDGIRVLRLGDGLNAFDAMFLDDLDRSLDAVEADDAAMMLVTIGGGKHYSNGYDLQFMGGLAQEDLKVFIDHSSAVLARFLVFPVPTVAALNGHAFGIGALLALAHDQRVQNTERGWFCLPEVDLRMRFNPFQLAMVTGKLSRPTALDAVLSGGRYDAQLSLDAGIVDAVARPDELVTAATLLASARTGKDRAIVRTLKGDLYAAILAKLG